MLQLEIDGRGDGPRRRPAQRHSLPHLLSIHELKSGLASTKSDVTELKKKVAELEKPRPPMHCSWCKGTNHIERMCHAKAADLAKKAALVPVP